MARQEVRGAIWMLHRVAPARIETSFQRYDKSTRITPEFLEECLQKALAEGYHFISLAELCQNLKNKKGDSKDIVVTIDDGYRDIYEYAFPIFKKYQVPFTFYVVSDFARIGFDRCRRPEFEGGQLAMDLIYDHQNFCFEGEHFPAKTIEEKAYCFDKMWKLFKRCKKKNPQVSGRQILRDYFKGYELDFDKYLQKYGCSAGELKEMKDSGLGTIGVHGKTHCPLAKLKHKAELEDEIAASKHELEAVAGFELKDFSYPYGSYNRRAVKLAKKHYQSAVCVTKKGCGNSFVMSKDDLFLLPRISVEQGINPLTQPQVPEEIKWYQFWRR